MSRLCCPECDHHPVLWEGLECFDCHGKYVWKKADKRDDLGTVEITVSPEEEL